MRGYQKKVVYLKSIDSSIFEEAYFVLKTDITDLQSEKNRESFDLVREANRIIEENTSFGNKGKKAKTNLKSILVFLVGFVSCALISLFFFI